MHYRVCHNIFSERSLHNGFNLLGFIGQKNKNLICGSDNISVIAVFIFQLFAVINRGFTQSTGNYAFIPFSSSNPSPPTTKTTFSFLKASVSSFPSCSESVAKQVLTSSRSSSEKDFCKALSQNEVLRAAKIQACNSFSVLLLCVCVFGFQRCLEFWCNAQISRYLCIVIGGVPTLKGVGIILITRFFRYGLRHNRRLAVLNLCVDKAEPS